MLFYLLDTKVLGLGTKIDSWLCIQKLDSLNIIQHIFWNDLKQLFVLQFIYLHQRER